MPAGASSSAARQAQELQALERASVRIRIGVILAHLSCPIDMVADFRPVLSALTTSSPSR